jgi:hypothetical protein
MRLHSRSSALAAAAAAALALLAAPPARPASATEAAAAVDDDDPEVIEWITPTPQPPKPFSPLIDLEEENFDEFVQTTETVLVEL